jgi:hypothetical protein
MVSGLSLLLATGCSGTALQQALEADPQLQDRPVFTEEDPETAAERGPTLPERSATSETSEADADSASDADAPSRTSIAAVLNDVPEDLRPYVQNWLALGLFEQSTGSTAATPAFQPNQPITRGDFAHWLLTANNEFYKDVPAKRIRPSTASATPAFQDVPTSHPHFAAIQGLAEAGIIPSAKTGNATAVNFRPDAPLTRETLVLWKVPLDTRAALPTADAEAVTTAWGFQDTAQVEPLALRAVLADHQNGDFANIRRAFGYTTLLQPQKGVTEAEAAAALWRFGNQTEGVSAKDLLGRPTSSSGSQESANPTKSP